MKQKIILGTVQLGISYGINNKTGKPTQQEAFKILDFAWQNKIDLLDSADGYGESLEVIGRYKTESNRSFRVINKFKADVIPLSDKLEKSLSLLKCSALFCYMYHQFSDYQAGVCAAELIRLKNEGKIEKIGVSIYSIQELEKAVADDDIDIIQLPVNILDLSKEKQAILHDAKDRGKEIHARSVFLQGLFFRDSETLPGNLYPLKPYLDEIAERSNTHKVDVKMAALNFVLNNKDIDYVVLGVEQLRQLEENLAIVNPDFDSSIFEGINVGVSDSHLLNPANWKI